MQKITHPTASRLQYQYTSGPITIVLTAAGATLVVFGLVNGARLLVGRGSVVGFVWPPVFGAMLLWLGSYLREAVSLSIDLGRSRFTFSRRSSSWGNETFDCALSELAALKIEPYHSVRGPTAYRSCLVPSEHSHLAPPGEAIPLATIGRSDSAFWGSALTIHRWLDEHGVCVDFDAPDWLAATYPEVAAAVARARRNANRE